MDDIIVDIPNVGQVAFPASMSEQEVNAAAKRLYDESLTQPQEMPMQDQIGRQLGLTGRAAISGIAALPNIIADPFARLAGMTPPSEALQRTLTRAGFPEPTPGLEQYVQAGTEALTGAGGQISLARQAAQQLASPVSREVSQQLAQAPATQLAAAPVATSAAMKTFEETGSPVAATVAGLGAGAATGIRPRRAETTMTEQLGRQATQAYKRAENAGLVVRPDYIRDMADSLTQKAMSEGYDSGLHPKIAAVLRRLEDEGATPKTLAELDNLRRIVRAPGGDFTNPDQQRIAGQLVDEFDSFVENIGSPNILPGADKDVAIPALKEARDVYKRKRKVSIIEDMMDAAEIRGAQQTQAGVDNTIRNQFANLSTNKKRMAAFSKNEQAEIKRIAKGGGSVQQMLRFLGRFAVRGPVTGIFAGGGLAYEPAFAVPMTLTAEASKRGAEALRRRDVSRLINQIAQQQLPSQPSLVPTTAMRGLLSSQQGME
jgi:hypothetical protein